jgi:hypothetical protein
MKTEIKLSIHVPDWLYRYRWKNIKGYMTWMLRPNKCCICGNRMAISHPNVNWMDEYGHTKMMGQADVELDYTKCVCPSCVAKATVEGTFVPKRQAEKYQRFDVMGTCDHCHNKTKSYKWTAINYRGYNIGLILGNYCSWNSAHYCPECIGKIFSDGKQSSGILSSHKGKFAYQNNFGLPVIDGKVHFPDR